jgi:hypothetical protein
LRSPRTHPRTRTVLPRNHRAQPVRAALASHLVRRSTLQLAAQFHRAHSWMAAESYPRWVASTTRLDQRPQLRSQPHRPRRLGSIGRLMFSLCRQEPAPLPGAGAPGPLSAWRPATCRPGGSRLPPRGHMRRSRRDELDPPRTMARRLRACRIAHPHVGRSSFSPLASSGPTSLWRGKGSFVHLCVRFLRGVPHRRGGSRARSAGRAAFGRAEVVARSAQLRRYLARQFPTPSSPAQTQHPVGGDRADER